MERVLLTKRDVCEMLGVSRATFDRMRAAGKAPKQVKSGKLDNRPRWLRSVVERWLGKIE